MPSLYKDISRTVKHTGHLSTKHVHSIVSHQMAAHFGVAQIKFSLFEVPRIALNTFAGQDNPFATQSNAEKQ